MAFLSSSSNLFLTTSSRLASASYSESCWSNCRNKKVDLHLYFLNGCFFWRSVGARIWSILCWYFSCEIKHFCARSFAWRDKHQRDYYTGETMHSLIFSDSFDDFVIQSIWLFGCLAKHFYRIALDTLVQRAPTTLLEVALFIELLRQQLLWISKSES